MWSKEQPGLGIDIDEKQAAKYPFPGDVLNGAWPPVRNWDGAAAARGSRDWAIGNGQWASGTLRLELKRTANC